MTKYDILLIDNYTHALPVDHRRQREKPLLVNSPKN